MSYFDTIYADTLLPHRAIPVYMYLKDRSGSTGSCWPGIKTIIRFQYTFVPPACPTPYLHRKAEKNDVFDDWRIFIIRQHICVRG